MAGAHDPFAEFEDWLIDGPAGEWPQPEVGALTDLQKEIVNRNALLLLSPGAWEAKVERFTTLLSQLGISERDKKRQDFHIRFDGVAFKRSQLSFTSFIFPCVVSFQRATFNASSVDFTGALFYGNVCFDGANFKSHTSFGAADVSFGGARCETGTLSFRATVFGEGRKIFRRMRFGEGDVSFEKANFSSGDVTFDHAVFRRGDVTFEGAQFGNGDVSFHSVRFGPGNVTFLQTQFGDGELSFNLARFGRGEVNFGHATFGDGNVRFERTDFGRGDVSFSKIESISGHFSFTGATFGPGVAAFDFADLGNGFLSFREATFESHDVVFTGASFGEGDVVFTDTDMSTAHLWFQSLRVVGRLRCDGMKALDADFSNTTVEDVADWTDASFTFIPDFRNMKLDRPPEVARMDVPEPQLSNTRTVTYTWPIEHEYTQRDRVFRRATNGDDVLRLRKLKAMAIEANDHEKDGQFFAYEMMAKRGTEHTTFWQLLASSIYSAVSFYGQSYLRPLAWLGGSFVAFAGLYAGMATAKLGWLNALGFGATYSLKNSLPFLGAITRSVPTFDKSRHISWFRQQLDMLLTGKLPVDWFTVLGTGQAVLSLFFFFFLLLGLRNRFRLK